MSSVSTSDHDMSEYSNSPSSYSGKSSSPYGSPSQQMPQLLTDLTELSCTEKFLHNFIDGGKPHLRIIEQPQNHFRFRYVSEMVGTHGCLLGKTYTPTNKAKTHPTVELVNYTGKALIRCSLAQHNIDADHPHRLLEDDKDRDVSSIVPENGSYIVGFAGMGIIHTAKKDVPGLLFQKFSEQMKGRHFNPKEMKAQCDNLAKNINLNIVRLKFSAHDLITNQEICEPVFSEPIHNLNHFNKVAKDIELNIVRLKFSAYDLFTNDEICKPVFSEPIYNPKSAATNDLKIVRISRHTGKPSGREEVFIFVEKVNKKNIRIRFYELDANGQEVWEDFGSFIQSDVHHQYGIVFRTPPYKNEKTPVDVKVYIELLRPTDGRTSEPKEFVYQAEQVYRLMTRSKERKEMLKRRREQCSSIDSSSSGSINTLLPSSSPQYNNDVKPEPEIPVVTLPSPIVQAASTSPIQACGLGSALTGCQPPPTTMWYQSTVETATSIPNLSLHSSEFDEILKGPLHLEGEDAQYKPADFNGYLSIYSSMDDEMNAMGFLRSSFVADSANIHNKTNRTTLVADSGRTCKEEPSSSKSQQKKSNTGDDSSLGYSASYQPEDGLEVKKLVTELSNIIRDKKGYKSQEARSKLERLFDIRLNNGDTFLHMTLFSNVRFFEQIVKVIHHVKMSHLLNYTNHKLQTILHLAVVHRSPKLVTFLLSKGCDPKLKDSNDNDAIHYAVNYNESCLEPLLEAVDKYKVPCDNYNNEKQTALHVAACKGSGDSVRALLAAGWRADARDSNARTPLHLAALDARLDALRELLAYIPQCDVDVTDGLGNTALQIVCGSNFNQHTIEMAKLLLEHKADPSKQEDNNESAWKLSRDQPELRDLIKRYLPSTLELNLEEDIKSEPEDEFESADEDIMDETPLSGLKSYINEVSAIVDGKSQWRALSDRLAMTPMNDWFAPQPSPTAALLKHVKECGENVSSKYLAVILDDMNLNEAALIVRQYIE